MPCVCVTHSHHSLLPLFICLNVWEAVEQPTLPSPPSLFSLLIFTPNTLIFLLIFTLSSFCTLLFHPMLPPSPLSAFLHILHFTSFLIPFFWLVSLLLVPSFHFPFSHLLILTHLLFSFLSQVCLFCMPAHICPYYCEYECVCVCVCLPVGV